MADAKEIKYGASRVTINQRGDGRFLLRWREADKWKYSTAKDEKRATSKAREIAKRIDENSGVTRVNVEESRALELIKENLGKRTLLDVASGINQLLRALPSDVPITGIAREWEKHLDIKHVPLKTLNEKIRKLYDTESGKSKESYKSIRFELQAFVDKHPALSVQDIDPEFLDTWLKRKLANGSQPSAQYFNNRLAVWKNVLNRAREWEMLPENEKTAAERIPKKTLPRRIPPVFSIQEAQDCIQFLHNLGENELLAGFAIAAFSGMRPSEIQRLEWSNIDLKSGYIHADEHVCRKLQQERFIPISDNLKVILTAMKQWKGLICPKHRWIKISLTLRDKEVITKWPEDVLRHSYISYRVAETQDIARVAEESGNSPKVIKARYRRPLKPEQGKAWFKIGLHP
ncbi:MAG: tyrosine-type recombinase/integrase [Akkermansiaceae bacterium]